MEIFINSRPCSYNSNAPLGNQAGQAACKVSPKMYDPELAAKFKSKVDKLVNVGLIYLISNMDGKRSTHSDEKWASLGLYRFSRL